MTLIWTRACRRALSTCAFTTLVHGIPLVKWMLADYSPNEQMTPDSKIRLGASLASVLCGLVTIVCINLSHISWISLNSSSSPPPSKELSASLWEQISFSWFNELVTKGYYKLLDMDDVYDLGTSDKSSVCHNKFKLIRYQF